MAQKLVLTYSPSGSERSAQAPTAVYYLATTSDLMRFYLFEEPREGRDNSWTLIDELDRTRLQGAGNKATAKTFAKRLGLKTWTYVRV